MLPIAEVGTLRLRHAGLQAEWHLNLPTQNLDTSVPRVCVGACFAVFI